MAIEPIEPIQPRLPLRFKRGSHDSTFGSIQDDSGLTLCFSSPQGQGVWIVNTINKQLDKLRALGELSVTAHEMLDDAGIPRYDHQNQKLLLPARIHLLICQRDQLTIELMAQSEPIHQSAHEPQIIEI